MLITHKFIVCTRIVIIACVLLIVLLSGFEWFPLSSYGTTYLNNADVQRVRSQILVKSALTLEYRPASERTQAITDLQIVLPLFIAEQTSLTGNHHSDIEQSVQLAQPDYLAMVSAAQAILRETQTHAPIDTTQVDILVAHNKNYLSNQSAIVAAIVAHQQSYQTSLFEIEIAFGVLLLLILGGFLLRFELARRRYKQTTGQ